MIWNLFNKKVITRLYAVNVIAMKSSTTSQRKEDPSYFCKRNISGNDNIVRTFWERKTGLGKLVIIITAILVNGFYVLQTFLYEQP